MLRAFVVGIWSVFLSISSYSQQIGTAPLSEEDLFQFLCDSVKKELGITLPVIQSYTYSDKNGKHFLVLMKGNNPTELYDSVKGLSLTYIDTKNQLTKDWEFQDCIRKKPHYATENYAIEFLPEYFQLNDINKDENIDPIIVYKTTPDEDSFVKIIVCQNNEKCTIRNKNMLLPEARFMQIDHRFYEFDISIQEHIQQMMETMIKNNDAIFPYGWKKDMNNQLSQIEERF